MVPWKSFAIRLWSTAHPSFSLFREAPTTAMLRGRKIAASGSPIAARIPGHVDEPSAGVVTGAHSRLIRWPLSVGPMDVIEVAGLGKTYPGGTEAPQDVSLRDA